MEILHTRKSPEQIRQALAALVLATKGGSDTSGLLQPFQLRLGYGLLSCFYQAYLIKAKGGTDEMGIRWDPLKRETIAYKRLHPGLNAKRKKAAAEGRPGRPLLSEQQDTLWRKTYAQFYAKYEAAGEGDASGHAAAIAWIITKAAGGKTIIGEYGDTPVEIGRDTGRALNSMAAAIRSSSSNEDTEVRAPAGMVEVAIKRPGMVHFHKRRPLWDSSRPLPQSYREVLDDVTTSFIGQVLPRLLAN